MTPKEKAQELIRKYYRLGLHQDGQSLNWMEAKQCAIIAVDEILQNVYDDRATIGRRNLTDKEYWTEVKQEIEKI